MFTLRKVTSNGIVSNQFIGDEYSILRKSSNKEQFEKLLNQNYNFNDKIYAFIRFGGNTMTLPLYLGNRYFIVSSNGNTFEKIRP